MMYRLMKVIADKFRAVVSDDSRRNELMLIVIDVVLAVVSAVMTVVNIFTKEYVVMYATIACFVICAADLFILKLKAPRWLVFNLLTGSLLCVLFFFIISGHPDGFSALWLSLIPMLAMMLMGIVKGSIYSGVAFVGLIFLFWTPVGRDLLLFPYGNTFLLRYPLFYLAVYALSLTTEYIRKTTQERLQEANERYSHLYKHDALTGLYNRYGMNELIRKTDSSDSAVKCAVIILDIDDFKKVNDTYGHDAGDEVLKNVANVIAQTVPVDCRFARWGGEEFLIFTDDDKGNFHDLAEAIRSNVAASFVNYDNTQIKVTISLGLCTGEVNSSAKSSRLIISADKALYGSKTSGKNKVTVINL